MAALPARHASPASLRRAAGFTLMEIMVVVIVVGILAGIALPAYQESMRKSRRTDAKQALMDAANREEQYMLDRSTYTKDMTALYSGLSADPKISEDQHYQVDRIDCDAISAGNNAGTTAACPMVCSDDIPTCYVLQAKARSTSPQKEDKKCTTFSLDSTGVQTATGTDKNNCW